VLSSSDVLAAIADFRDRGLDRDERLLPEREVYWWSGAPLAGVPPQFRLRDPDGNSYLVIAVS